jgi:hypothetical protein
VKGIGFVNTAAYWLRVTEDNLVWCEKAMRREPGSFWADLFSQYLRQKAILESGLTLKTAQPL